MGGMQETSTVAQPINKFKLFKIDIIFFNEIFLNLVELNITWGGSHY